MAKNPIYCWKCKKEVGEEPIKIGFRAECPHCGADLHTCKNCRYYAPGKPNDCEVTGTEFIRDREAFNFCEEFKVILDNKIAPNSDKAKKLFGEEPPKKNDFGSLFKDDAGR